MEQYMSLGCHKVMFTRLLSFAVLVAAGCATSGVEHSSSANHSIVARPPITDPVPALFRHAPWSTMTDAEGHLVFVQGQANLQFGSRSGELERTKVRVFDEATNDVGFFYGGAFPHSSPRCVYGLTVYVYPATEPLDRHLEALRDEIIRVNPEARVSKRILNLDREHEGTGLNAGYLNHVNGLESFEGVSIYQRAGWFIKYRTTIGPAENIACEQRLRAAVAKMQVSKR